METQLDGTHHYAATDGNPLRQMREDATKPMRQGKVADIHPDAIFLETNLNGMHHSYYEGLLAQSPHRGGIAESLSGEVLSSIAATYHTNPLTNDELVEHTKQLADEHIEWKTGKPSPQEDLGINRLPRAELPYKEVSIAATVAATKKKFGGTKDQQKVCEETLKAYGHSAEMIRRLVTVRYSMACTETDLVAKNLSRANRMLSKHIHESRNPDLWKIQERLEQAEEALLTAQRQHARVAGLYLSLHLTLPRIMLNHVVPTTKPAALLTAAATLLDPATAASNRVHSTMVEVLQGETPKKRKKQPKGGTLAVSPGFSNAGGRSGNTASGASPTKRQKKRRAAQRAGEDGAASPGQPRANPKPKQNTPRKSPPPTDQPAASDRGGSPRSGPKGQPGKEGKKGGQAASKGGSSPSPNKAKGGKAKNRKGGFR